MYLCQYDNQVILLASFAHMNYYVFYATNGKDNNYINIGIYATGIDTI